MVKRNRTQLPDRLYKIINQSKESWLLWLLGMLFVIILMRLFWLQVVTSFKYDDQLIQQHFTTQDLKADR